MEARLDPNTLCRNISAQEALLQATEIYADLLQEELDVLQHQRRALPSPQSLRTV